MEQEGKEGSHTAGVIFNVVDIFFLIGTPRSHALFLQKLLLLLHSRCKIFQSGEVRALWIIPLISFRGIYLGKSQSETIFKYMLTIFARSYACLKFGFMQDFYSYLCSNTTLVLISPKKEIMSEFYCVY